MSVFHEAGYVAHNKARLDHLASLNLPLQNRDVLELGAGIGDHTQFFLDRECRVLSTDGRSENIEEMLRLHPARNALVLDVEDVVALAFTNWKCDVIFCYGLLYHLANPLATLLAIAAMRPSLFLLETCVASERTTSQVEDPDDPRCSIHGKGNRLYRELLWRKLRFLFDFVYVPITQPNHEEFPLNWIQPTNGECRAVFIISSEQIVNPLLTRALPMTQIPC